LCVIGVRSVDLGSRRKELEVGCFSCREKVGGGLEDGRPKVEGAIIPSEGKLVSPNTYKAKLASDQVIVVSQHTIV
jgi:hypothetical protein